MGNSLLGESVALLRGTPLTWKLKAGGGLASLTQVNVADSPSTSLLTVFLITGIVGWAEIQ